MFYNENIKHQVIKFSIISAYTRGECMFFKYDSMMLPPTYTRKDP